MAANRKVYDRALRGYRAAFQSAFGMIPGLMEWMAFRLDGSSTLVEEELFPTLQDADVPRFKDRRIYKDIKWYSFESMPEVRGEGIRIPRRDFRVDRWAAHMSLFRRLGAFMRRTQHREMVSFLVNGFGGSKGLAYDGQFFFDDHADNSGATWTNAHNLALTAGNFDTVYQALESARWPDGVYALQTAENYSVSLVVGPALRTTAEEIVQAERQANGATNTRRGRAKVVVLQDLSPSDPDFGAFSDHWFLTTDIGDAEAKPLTFNDADPTELVELTDPDNPATFEDDHYRFGVRGEWGVGYRAPWVVQGSQGG